MKVNHAQLQSWALTILRIAVGIVFLAHGTQKLFTFGLPGVAAGMAAAGIPFPYLSAVLVTATETLGGIALILGLLARLAAVPLAVVMLVAAFQVHLAAGFFLPNGYEFAFTLLATLLALGLAGPGAFALDNILVKTRRKAQAVSFSTAA